MTSSETTSGYDQFRQVFFDECDERLDELREMMAEFQGGQHDSELLNAIFRAVHSIKAGAGAFKYKRLVEFSHVFENVLDLLRDDVLAIDEDLVAAMVTSSDILADLVNAAQTDTELSPDHERATSETLVKIISSSAGEASQESQEADTAQEEESGPEERIVLIKFTPNQDLFRYGNEPLLMIRELRQFGPVDVNANICSVPCLENYDPETCYLKWYFKIITDAPLDELKGVFEFVLDDCDVVFSEQKIEKAKTVVQQSDEASAEELDGVFGLFDTPETDTVAAPETQSQEPQAAEAPKPAKEAKPKPAPEGKNAASNNSARVSSIRVDLDRVDRLVNMVGELVIAQSMVLQRLTDSPSNNSASQNSGIEDLTQRTRELQEGVMAIRMQPVKSIFMRMPRVVRETAPKLGKNVELVTVGEHTEVDKTIIEELSEPLTHMIRNSLDHGLEMPADRLAAGKPEKGTIKLTAEHRGGRILICVSDDGHGLNIAKIKSRAIEKGLIAPNADLSDNEIHQLILMPGFSTAETVSDISGRGVGMDVVKRKVQNLGGRISVESVEGKGTTFTLALPLTLAVLDGMLVSAGPENYVVPLTSIVETLRPLRSQLRLKPNGDEILSIRGEYVSLVYLSDIFEGINSTKRADESLVVLLESEGNNRFGLVVDQLLGQQQVVIKNLEEHYKAVPGVAGATILGDGRVSLILDIDALSKLKPIEPSSRRWTDPSDEKQTEPEQSDVSIETEAA